MTAVTFQGASDDLIEIAGCEGADEFTAGAGDAGVFRLSAAEGSLLVRVAYERHGCWSVAVMPTEEDVPIPLWPVRFGAPLNGYTACLEIDCPSGVRLVREDET